jgi:hypothetical protein
MSYRVCGEKFTSRSGQTLVCTAPAKHTEALSMDPRRFYHSWEWLRRGEVEEEPPAHPAAGPPEIDDLIEGVAAGLYDPYIESLLAALHGRKRAMRSVPHPYGRNE